MASTLRKLVIVALSTAALAACGRPEKDHAAAPAAQTATPEQARLDAAEDVREQTAAKKINDKDAAERATLLKTYPNVSASDLYIREDADSDHPIAPDNFYVDKLLQHDDRGRALCLVPTGADSVDPTWDTIVCSDMSKARDQIKAWVTQYHSPIRAKDYWLRYVDEKGTPYCVYTGDDVSASCESVIKVDAASNRLKQCVMRVTGIKSTGVNRWTGWNFVDGNGAQLFTKNGGDITYVADHGKISVTSMDGSPVSRHNRLSRAAEQRVFRCFSRFKVPEYQ